MFAQASLFQGEALDTAADAMAWVVLVVAPAVGIAGLYQAGASQTGLRQHKVLHDEEHQAESADDAAELQRLRQQVRELKSRLGDSPELGKV